MWEFFQNYGLWIVLGLIFVAMQWFGSGCCGGDGHKSDRGTDDDKKESKLQNRNAGQSDRRQQGG